MIIADIVNSCSNDKVADAAVACIGRDFSRRVGVLAKRRGVETGVFAAHVVREFELRAGDRQREALERAVERADMPVLNGLRLILEAELDKSAM